MNKGFAYYFRKAVKTSMQAIFKSKNVLQGMLYFFTSLIARLTVIFTAMPALADVKQAKIARRDRTIDVPLSFTEASRKPFWTMTVALFLELLIYLGGLILVGAVCGVIYAIGLAISNVVTSSPDAIILIFSVPCLIIALIYSIIVITIFSPTAYVVDNNPQLSAGEVVSVCVNSMKSRGKLTVILCIFIPTLIIGAIAGVLGLGFYLISTLLATSGYMNLLLVLLAVVSVIVLGFTMPVLTLTKNVALVSLFDDIALDPVNANKRTAGINIRRISGAKLDREEVADNLSALFDDGIEEKTPDEEHLAHRHKKKPRQYAEVDPDDPNAAEPDLTETDDYADELPAQTAEAASGSQQAQPAAQPAQQTAQPAQPASQPAQPEQHAQPAAQPAQPAAQPVQPEQHAQPAAQPAQQAQPAQPAQQPQPAGQPMGGQPVQGQPHPAGQPMGGQPVQGQPHPAGQPMGGQPVQGQPHPAGQPMNGQPPYGQPRPAGQPMGGQPPYGQPHPAGQPMNGQPPYGQPRPAGQPMGGQPPYGQPNPAGQPMGGQPPYGQPNPAGQPMNGQPMPPRPPQGNGANGNG